MTAEEASRHAAEFWKRKGAEWIGPDVVVDDSQVSQKRHRVHLYGGGWNIAVAIPLSGAEGSYELVATGPCI